MINHTQGFFNFCCRQTYWATSDLQEDFEMVKRCQNGFSGGNELKFCRVLKLWFLSWKSIGGLKNYSAVEFSVRTISWLSKHFVPSFQGGSQLTISWLAKHVVPFFQGSSQPLLSHVALAVASKLTSALFNAAR